MASKNSLFSSRQLLFQELFVGTLIFVTVLGLLSDYTSIVATKSFSTIIFASFTLELLVYAAFWLKKQLRYREGKFYRVLMFFCVWFVMFMSKFVFVWALDTLFGTYLDINGFVGIIIIVTSTTIIHRLAGLVFKKLGLGRPNSLADY